MFSVNYYVLGRNDYYEGKKKMLISVVFLCKRDSFKIKNENKIFIKLDKLNYIKTIL